MIEADRDQHRWMYRAMNEWAHGTKNVQTFVLSISPDDREISMLAELKPGTLLYAEYLAEDLLLDLPHRQFVFTIAKILRPYFKSDKRLFGEVSKLIFCLLSDFFD